MQQPANAVPTGGGRAYVVVANEALPGEYITIDFLDGIEVRRAPATARDIAQFELRRR